MGTMYDAANPGGIPDDATAVAGYTNGRYRWPMSAWARWGNKPRLPIQIFIPGVTTDPVGDANLTCDYAAQVIVAGGWVAMDVEAPDVHTAQGSYSDRWADQVRARGFRPVIYTSKSTKYPCNVDWWLAEWDNPPKAHLIVGTVATQYAAVGPYDLSVTVDGFPSMPVGSAPTSAPAPVPAPVPSPGEDHKPFPLPAGHWYGRPSADNRNHSGFYWTADRHAISVIQGALGISQDGKYGNETYAHVVAFQRTHGLTVDGLVGPATWSALT